MSRAQGGGGASRESLGGIRVLDCSGGVAGQFAGRLLAEHGAEVTLVEPPGGTPTRHARGEEDAFLFRHLNSGKRSLAVDAGTAEGAGLLRRALACAHVLIEDGEGVEPPAQGRPPGLVAARLRDFPAEGPYARWRGSEMIHQALSGLMYATGRAEREPLYGFGHRAYYSAGAAAVSAVVGALMQAMDTGEGRSIEISVYETAIAMSQNLAAQYSYNGSYQKRGPYPGACDIFQCRDGWVSMYCRGDRWAAVCAALGDPDLVLDERFRSTDVLLRHWQEAYARLAPRIRALPVDDVVARIEGARGLAARVYTMADLLDCPHLAARAFWETAGPAGEQKILGPVFRMGGTPRRVRHAAPDLAAPPVGEAHVISAADL